MIKIEVLKDKQFVRILVDGEEWKKIDKRLYTKHLGKIRSCHDKKSLIDLFSVLDKQVALAYIYKLLAMKGYMANQLRKKLKERCFTEEVIETTLATCCEAGYIDDMSEARNFVEREKRRGQGPRMIQRRLQEKAGESLEFSFSEKEERVLLQLLLEKRFPDLSELKTKQRAFRFLQRRGFTESLIQEFLFAPNKT